MIKKMDNYKILFSLRILKSILNNFVDVFLVLYFLKVSNSNILPLGIYKLISVIAIWFVIFLVRNFCKVAGRIRFLRIGIILSFIYFLSIIILREKVVNYIYFIGLLYGLEEGFYYSVYNMIESDGIVNKERAKYIGSYTAVKNFISIIFPLIFGGLIQKTGFINTTIFVLFIVILQIILSNVFQDNNIPKSKKTDFKKFGKAVKGHKEFTNIITTKICAGLTYSEGALSYVITIYIIKIFSESISLGIFTSIFSIISMIIGLLFVKVIKPKYYNSLMILTSTITIILLCVMLLNCNFITIVLYNLFQTISKGLTDLINEKNVSNFSNIKSIKKEFKVEYFLSIETSLFIGRVISNLLFIFMAFTNSNYIMPIFIIFAIMRAVSSIRLQFAMNNCKEINDDETSIKKVIIFDWGGVVESHENNLKDLKDAKIRMIRKLNNKLTDEQILTGWTEKNSNGVFMGTTNKTEDIKDWVDIIQKNMNINMTFDEFMRLYEKELSTVKYYKEVVDYAHSLKDKCKIAILSNLMPVDKKRIDDQYKLNEFDYVYLSFEIGFKKPDKQIYEYVLNDLKIDGNNILFIDDDTDNILIAKECGWNTCQAFGYELDKIKLEVEKFLKE